MTQKRKGTERELPAEGRREKVGESEKGWKLHWNTKVHRLRVQIASYKNSHKDVKYNIGNIVDNIVITTCGVKWVRH